ncbi:MAG TPA: class I SAM-dependent methyltransferase [Mycobacteriales bacterium]|nr:class I SAM-dependent methyltransferase [Mycobacteriales bacterium]
MNRWTESGDRPSGSEYAERFAALARSGVDVHGEATLCASLVPAGARVLDAGCGTGRVAIRLAELGYCCVGVDSDPSMLAEARRSSDAVTWVESDLADLDAADVGPEPFDLVVMAGNVVPLLADGTEAAAIQQIAHRLATGGTLVAGFGLDRAHLPPGASIVSLDDYDIWCAAAGLTLAARWATWDQHTYTPDAGYAVSVQRR